MNKLTVQQINATTYFGATSGAVIQIEKEVTEPDAGSTMPASSGNPWASWGADNDRPQKIIDENMADPASAGSLRFKINAHFGGGLIWFTKEKKGDKDIIQTIPEEELHLKFPEVGLEIEDFAFYNDLQNLQQRIITDFEWWSFYHLQYIPNRAGNRIIFVDWKRTRDIRPEKRDKILGTIRNFYLSGHWPMPKKDKRVKVPALDIRDPFKRPAIYRHQLPSVDRDYYPMAYWQSNLAWLSVAKRIPKWIASNIHNSINIKYHIKIPEKYFTSLHPRDRYDSDELWEAALLQEQKDFFDKMDKFLAGEDQAMKTFYSKFAIDESGNQIPGFEIMAVENEMKDEAWLNAYGSAAAAICTAHGVPPSLAGLILSNGLGTGSASDTREQFNYYMQLNTVIGRQTTLEWFYFVKRFNKWPNELHLGYKEIVLQTIDKNKSGVDKTAKPNPTTDEV